MASEVCTALGLQRDWSGKVIHVAEEHGSDSSFMLGSLAWLAAQRDPKVLLLALHNSREHYMHVAKKLGLELLRYVTFLEPLYKKYYEQTRQFDALDMSKEDNLKRLSEDLDRAMEVGEQSGPMCLIIDDLSDLMCMGASLQQTLVFFQYCWRHVIFRRELMIVVGTHFADHVEDLRLLTNAVAHQADCRITVAPLRSGFSASVTGTVRVDGKMSHYKLSDRQVKVFAPGTPAATSRWN